MFGLFKEKSQKNGVNQSKKYFGAYGGQFVPETLMPALEEFEATFQKYFYTKEYQAEFQQYLKISLFLLFVFCLIFFSITISYLLGRCHCIINRSNSPYYLDYINSFLTWFKS